MSRLLICFSKQTKINPSPQNTCSDNQNEKMNYIIHFQFQILRSIWTMDKMDGQAVVQFGYFDSRHVTLKFSTSSMREIFFLYTCERRQQAQKLTKNMTPFRCLSREKNNNQILSNRRCRKRPGHTFAWNQNVQIGIHHTSLYDVTKGLT